jgi:O-acetylserine/cysteine efflux transporter
MKQSMSLADILTALAVVAIWGVNFVVIKIGLSDLPPVLFTALRFLCAALPQVFFVPRPRAAWHLVAAYGLFQFALQFTLLFTGIKLGLPAGLASLVIQLQAFFTIGLAVLMLGERPRGFQLAGALVAFAGMALVAAKLEGQATLAGFVLVVAAGLCWALANITTRKMGTVSALSLVVWGSLIATPPLFVASLLMEGVGAWRQAAASFSLVTLGAVLFNAYPNTILGFGVWSMLIRRYAAATVAPFTLLVPVAGMVSAALVLGEPLQWWKIAAGLLVLSGLALNQFGPRILARLRAAP